MLHCRIGCAAAAPLPDDSQKLRDVADDGRRGAIRSDDCRAPLGFSLSRPCREGFLPRRADPLNRFPDERRSEVNASSDLRRKLVKTLGSEHTRGALRCGRQGRSHGEMKSGLKSNGLTHNP